MQSYSGDEILVQNTSNMKSLWKSNGLQSVGMFNTSHSITPKKALITVMHPNIVGQWKLKIYDHTDYIGDTL